MGRMHRQAATPKQRSFNLYENEAKIMSDKIYYWCQTTDIIILVFVLHL